MPEVLFSKDIENILDNLDFSKLGKNVAIKVHFGEKGCVTYLNPEIVKKVYNKIISLGKKAALVECNVLYRGSRTSSKDHLNTAKEHGFNFAPVDILDGENGQEYIEVDGCKLGKGIKKYDSLLVLSHFKGHVDAGFGASLKNIGMGLGSRAGKLDMHANMAPVVASDKCISCGDCKENCNFNAITLEPTAKVNPKKCSGCAMCIAVCPQEAIQVPWGGRSHKQVQKRIAEYSKAVLSLFGRKALFINVLENITKDCDCFGTKQEPVMENIGIVAGGDIVAVEQASLDLANKKGFEKVYKSIRKQPQIDYAEELGLGTKNYRLISKLSQK